MHNPVEDSHKVHSWNIQGQSPIGAFGRPPTFMDVMGMGGQFRVVGCIVVLQNAIPLSIQVNVGVIVLPDFRCGI